MKGIIDVKIGVQWEQVSGAIWPELNFTVHCTRLTRKETNLYLL
jgi:hypothetical protein